MYYSISYFMSLACKATLLIAKYHNDKHHDIKVLRIQRR